MLDTLNKLAATAKRTEKEAILKALSADDAELFKAVAVAAYSGDVNYYVKKYDRSDTHTGAVTLSEALQRLSALSSRQRTGGAAQAFLTALDADLSAADSEVLWRVIQRDLRCGVTATTANAIWPGLIYEHPYMRCSSFTKKNLARITFPCYSQTKADGLYVDIMVDEVGVVVYKTRSGETLDLNCEGRDAYFRQFKGFVFMGEALVIAADGIGVLSRKEGNGILNSSEADGNNVRFMLWDVVPMADFKKGATRIHYAARFNSLTAAIRQMGCPEIRLTNTKVVNSVAEVVAHFKEEVGNGEEGTVVKNTGALWKDGTSADQVKVKIVFECELKVVGIKEGTGKYAGKLGAFECESEDGVVKVSVGGGFSDAQRAALFVDDSIGKIITVAANDLVDDRNRPGVWSLFLPRFIEVRGDKNVADTYERICEQRDSFTDTLKAIK